MTTKTHKYKIGDKFRIDTYAEGNGRYDEVVVVSLEPYVFNPEYPDAAPSYLVALIDDLEDEVEVDEVDLEESEVLNGRPS